MIRIICGCLSLLAVSPVFAEALVAPDVVAVVEGGHWRQDGAEGSYRIIVVNQGFEHVSSRVVAEWKSTPNETGHAHIIHSVELVKGGFYSMGRPNVVFSGDEAHVELEGTATYAPGTPVDCRFNLSPGGKVTPIKECGD